MQGRSPLILGYHGIGEVELKHDPFQLYVRPETLISHVRILQRRGYEFVTMSRFADLQAEQGAPPRGVVALTFDDGTMDHATVLPGVLAELGVPGTVFVCPGLSGEPYPWADAGDGIFFMTEQQLVELARHPNIEIGAHTNEHHELHEADEATALEEMTACKSTLESLLGIEIVSFCYPRCHYSEGAAKAAARAGFKSAVTCGLWGSWDPYELKREVIHSRDGRFVFAMKERGSFSGLGRSLPARVVRRTVLGIESMFRMAPNGVGAVASTTLLSLIAS